jgi:hypothetical protein
MTTDLGEGVDPPAPPPTYCDSCGEQTATPPLCAECRDLRLTRIDLILNHGAEPNNPTADARWLLAEVGRLRATLARRGEQMDAERAQAAVDLGAALNGRDEIQAIRMEEIAALRKDRDRLARQVQQARFLADTIEEVQGGDGWEAIVRDLRGICGSSMEAAQQRSNERIRRVADGGGRL